jgi:hypothetical protein
MQIQPNYAPQTLARPQLQTSGCASTSPSSQAAPAVGDQVSLSCASAPDSSLEASILNGASALSSATNSSRGAVETANQSLATVAAATAGAAAGGVAARAIFDGLRTGFVKDYVDPQATLQQCQELVAKYPDLAELVELPMRTHGYDGKRVDLRGAALLYYLRLGPRTEDRDQKLGVFQHAAPHAREHVNPMTMLELANQLCANYDPNSTDPAVMANTALMDKLDIFIAPQPNPDGANYSFYDDKGWRKNRSPHDGVDNGVDINRNYPYKWTGSRRPDYQTYPGKGPASEPETQALIEVVNRHPNIRFVLDWHSYGEDLRRPLGVSKEDNPIYDEFHGRMKEAIASSRGRQYRPVVSQVVEGSSDDYWYHERGVYSTVIETARSFQPSKEEALAVMTECARGAREALTFAADHADRHGLAKANPPATATA